MKDELGGLKNILTVRSRLAESPRWVEAEQSLYWVDIYNHRVHCFQFFESGDLFSLTLPISGLATYSFAG